MGVGWRQLAEAQGAAPVEVGGATLRTGLLASLPREHSYYERNKKLYERNKKLLETIV